MEKLEGGEQCLLPPWETINASRAKVRMRHTWLNTDKKGCLAAPTGEGRQKGRLGCELLLWIHPVHNSAGAQILIPTQPSEEAHSGGGARQVIPDQGWVHDSNQNNRLSPPQNHCQRTDI